MKRKGQRRRARLNKRILNGYTTLVVRKSPTDKPVKQKVVALESSPELAKATVIALEV
jgi:hypothetical protein